MTRRDEPVPLRDAVAQVGRELGMPEPDALTTLVAAWPEIVGAALAQHATVRLIRNGECTIAVDGPAWASQLRYLASTVMERANERCGAAVVTSVKVVVSRR
jgi:predicted nucleic acid-binding Zn ribbon protein